MSKPVRTINRLVTSVDPHFYIYRWLYDLAGRRLPKRDVFVPDWVDPAWFDMDRVGFYFTVPSERWSAVLVRGSSDGQDVLEAMEADVAENARDPEYDRVQLAREMLEVRRLQREGMVTHEELHAQAICLLDGTFAERSQVGKYRVFRSNRVEVEAFADLLFNEADWLIVPVMPAFSWKKEPMEFPVEDPRYGSPMVHAVTRTPCPWQPAIQERGVFV